jgi:hypothetical protein
MDEIDEQASPDWFREPTRREHGIAGALFIGFGAFFVMLFFVQRGWWFSWVEIGLAAISLCYGLGHLIGLMRSKA